MGMFHISARGIWQASSRLALQAILDEIPSNSNRSLIQARANSLVKNHAENLRILEKAEMDIPSDGSLTVPNLLGVVRKTLPERTLFLNESITNFNITWSHLLSSRPGSHFTAGASSLGWGLGACVGASLAQTEKELICLIVGDGSFLFGVPSSAYWIARRYNTVRSYPYVRLGGFLSSLVAIPHDNTS
jgi:thiamine pyrophosphate-dependent acetolactate synthase large subunit-like protein